MLKNLEKQRASSIENRRLAGAAVQCLYQFGCLSSGQVMFSSSYSAISDSEFLSRRRATIVFGDLSNVFAVMQVWKVYENLELRAGFENYVGNSKP